MVNVLEEGPAKTESVILILLVNLNTYRCSHSLTRVVLKREYSNRRTSISQKSMTDCIDMGNISFYTWKNTFQTDDKENQNLELP